MKNLLFFILILGLTACGAAPTYEQSPAYSESYSAPPPPPPPPPPSPPADYAMDGVVDYEDVEIDRAPIRTARNIVRRSHEIEDPQRTIGVDDILSQLRSATLALTAPKTSNISDDVKIKLLVSLEKAQEELIAELEATEGSQVVSGDVQISKTMSATISAPDFDISTVTPTRQAITSIGSTEWLWTLRPKAPGGHHVSITLVAHVMVDNERVEKHIKTFEETLTIEITNKQRFINFIEAYWQWLLSTLLIPIALGAWKLWKSKE